MEPVSPIGHTTNESISDAMGRTNDRDVVTRGSGVTYGFLHVRYIGNYTERKKAASIFNGYLWF